MKKLTLIACLTFIFCVHSITSIASSVYDNRTVYAPNTNICVASFGGLILTQEILVFQDAEPKITYTRNILENWIYEKNDPGFYLQEFDRQNFYWQFVETKKYIGVVLIISGETIHPDFYTTLGSGLQVPGKENYGLHQNWNNNGDIFSFVINKNEHSIEHFENWKFTNHNTSPKWMTRSENRSFRKDSNLDFTEHSAENLARQLDIVINNSAQKLQANIIATVYEESKIIKSEIVMKLAPSIVLF